ncbi:MAG: HU family DNA-binding protein [Desulfomonile sp.]
MNKFHIAQALRKNSNVPLRKIYKIVDKFFETIFDALLSGDRIEIRGFGIFEVREHAGYTGRNPTTGEEIVVLPKKLPFFRVGKDLKERVNRK